jgi:RNA-directed DNA polymerase
MSGVSVGVTIVVRARESRVHGEGLQFAGVSQSKGNRAANEDEVPLNIGEIQRKLSLWAEQNEERKFYRLYRLLCDMDWLRLAHDYVAQNAGSITAGCDGINMSLFDENLEANLQQLAEELKSETFEPFPVRRVFIPKTNGRLRPLGIPSIRDRIVQEALRMILEPIYEAGFSQYSFGFRPNRCTMDAVRCILWSTHERKRFFWVIEGDISSYFDTINHRKLLKVLRRRIDDKRLLELIWKFLRAGVMERKLFRDTKRGTPQGGIISPLLANIYLNELDEYMEKYTGFSPQEKTRRRHNGQANFVYVRYADDFVVLSNGTKEQAGQLKGELHTFLKEKLRLNLSQEKTRITHLNDGFRFLGFKIQRKQGSRKMGTKVLIPKEAMVRMREKITHATYPTTHQDSVNSKILALNRIIGGWCRYYQYTSKAATQFHEVEYHTYWRMGHWLGRKFQLTMPEVNKRYNLAETIATKEYRLLKASQFPSLTYKKRFIKPNPYTTQEKVSREELPDDAGWCGHESRPGTFDLKPLILERDGFSCQMCGKPVTLRTSDMDHIKPVRRFKRPVDANHPDNLWTLCIDKCHPEKTKNDRRMESRMR